VLKEAAENEEQNEEQYGGNNLENFLKETYNSSQLNNINNIFNYFMNLDNVENFKFIIILHTFIDITELENFKNYDDYTKFIKENIDKYILEEKVLRIEDGKFIVKLNDNLDINLLQKYLQKVKKGNDDDNDDDDDNGLLRATSANSSKSSRTSYSGKINIDEENKNEIINKIKSEFPKAIRSNSIKTINNQDKHLNELTSDILQKIYEKLSADKIKNEIKTEYKDLLKENKPNMDYINLFGENGLNNKNIDNLDLKDVSVLKQQFNKVREAEEELKNKIIESKNDITLSEENTVKMNNILENFKDLHIDDKVEIIKTMRDNEKTNEYKINKILKDVDYYEDDYEGGSYNNSDITNTLQDIF